jgi:DegV family protein with EDD domain
VGIAYLDGRRLRQSLLAGSEWVEAARAELNRINVFPVPDGDTGTNFSMTLQAIAQAVAPLENAQLPDITRTMAEACILSAHGNSGLLLSQFLLGFRDALGESRSATPVLVAAGFRAGADRIAAALDEPVEGTILTVCRETADAAERAATDAADFATFMTRVLAGADASLQKTPELLAVLKQAGVVDAGGKGFVRLLEGVVRLIEGRTTVAAPGSEEVESLSPAAVAHVEYDRNFQFCTEVLVRGNAMPTTTQLRTALRQLGGSIVVLATDDLLKVHVHTDTPEAVFELASGWGDVVETKAEDMQEQHDALHDEDASPLGLVVDSSCDLPDEIVDRLGVILVPVQVMDETRTYLDRIEIGPEEIYRRMRTDGTMFRTSQPAPAAFLEAYRDARGGAREVLSLSVSGGLSGTFTAAQTAASVSDLGGITAFDSRSVSLGLGMLAMRARELSDRGWSTEQVVAELTRIRQRSGAFVVVDTFETLMRSGRVGRGRGWLGRLLDIKPILELTPAEGKVDTIDRVRGRKKTIPRVLAHLEKRLTPRPSRLRIGIAHADAAADAQDLQAAVQRRFQPLECLVADVTAALGAHVGPGAWAVFYQIEELHHETPGNIPSTETL